MLEQAGELPNWLLIWRISVPRHQRSRTRRRNRWGTIQVFGVKWHESLVRYDPDSCSWRTHRCLWDEALPWSSVTLPASGMTSSTTEIGHESAENRKTGETQVIFNSLLAARD